MRIGHIHLDVKYSSSSADEQPHRTSVQLGYHDPYMNLLLVIMTEAEEGARGRS